MKSMEMPVILHETASLPPLQIKVRQQLCSLLDMDVITIRQN